VPLTPETDSLGYREIKWVREPTATAAAIAYDRFSATGRRYRSIIRAARR
jgi:hypothetical protein